MNELDVLGLTLEDALEKFKDIGIEPAVTVTASLKTGEKEKGVLRVVRQTREGTEFKITLCEIPDSFR